MAIIYDAFNKVENNEQLANYIKKFLKPQDSFEWDEDEMGCLLVWINGVCINLDYTPHKRLAMCVNEMRAYMLPWVQRVLGPLMWKNTNDYNELNPAGYFAPIMEYSIEGERHIVYNNIDPLIEIEDFHHQMQLGLIECEDVTVHYPGVKLEDFDNKPILYGSYLPGRNKEALDDLAKISEFNLFYRILLNMSEIDRISNQVMLSHDDIVDRLKCVYILYYYINETSRFGIKVTPPEKENPPTVSEDYIDWFAAWFEAFDKHNHEDPEGLNKWIMDYDNLSKNPFYPEGWEKREPVKPNTDEKH